MDPNDITTAEQYFTHAERLTDPQRRRVFERLRGRERYLVLRGPRDDSRFDDQRITGRELHPSPSGRYQLVVTTHASPDQGWSYSRGRVLRVHDGELLAEVRRNYGMFPHCWMEDHVDGHDYLLCGEDYQGQTFCQLDTGEVFQHLPDGALQGHGFCWAAYWLVCDGRILVVDGCYWACPYELRLYDVSDPAKGWPQLPWPDEVDDDGVENTLGVGSLREQEGLLIWEDPPQDETDAPEPVRHRRVFRVQGRQVQQVEEWVSDALQIERRERARRVAETQKQQDT